MKTLRMLLIMMLVPVAAFAADPGEREYGIGEKGRDMEGWAQAKQDRNSALYNSLNSDGSTTTNSSINASALGNAIVIKTEPGSHVVLNATQINKGNQRVEVSLNNTMASQRYRNVETQNSTTSSLDQGYDPSSRVTYTSN